MTRTITKLTVFAVLALTALISVQVASAKTLPRTKVSVTASLARIQHPAGVSVLARFNNFQGGPLGVYGKQQGIVIPASLAGIMHPGGVYTVGR
jgi:hypothetical protein